MRIQYEIIEYFPTFTALLNYLESVEREYDDHGISYKYSISYRIAFDDYKLKINEIRYDG